MENSKAIDIETLQMVLDNIQSIVYVSDTEDHTVIFANKAMKAYCGEDVEGKKCWEAISKGNYTSPCPYCKFNEVASKPPGISTISELYEPNLGIWMHCNETVSNWADGKLAHVFMGTDITYIKDHQEALKKYQEELKQMLAEKTESDLMLQSIGNNLPDSFTYQVRIDIESRLPRVQYISKSAENILNVKTEKILNDARNFTDIFEPEDIDCIRENLQNRKPFALEAQVSMPGTSEKKWIYFSGIPRLNEDKTIQIIDGLALDITTRKNNEKALEDTKNELERLLIEKTENEEMLKSMSDNLPDSFVFQLREVPGQASIIEYISQGVEKICGKTPEELNGDISQLLELFEPEDANFLFEKVNLRESFTLEARLNIPGRKEHTWISFSEIPRTNHKNEIIWDGIAVDITSRKKTEAELQRSQMELLHNAELMNEISNNMANSGMYRVHTGENGLLKLDYVSGPMEQLLGIPTDELMEDLQQLIDRVHPDDRKEFKERIYSTSKAIAVESTEFRFMKDGQIYWYKLQSIGFEQDGILYRDGFVSDITEQKNFETQLINARDKAEEADKLKSTFMANMSHEIRTPMNAIIGFLEFLTNEEDIPREEQKEYMRIVSDNANQLLKLIGDILDISKIDAGQMRIVPEQTNVNVLLQDIHTSFIASNLMKDKEMELIIDNDQAHSQSMFTLDNARLRQILNNLIGNAIKFTDKGHVKFGYKTTEKGIHFFVEDTGIGIAKQKLDDLGKPFHQVHDQSMAYKYGGTGIGLAISTNLVRLMGGHFWVESEVGKGSVFQFTIPCKEIPSSLTEDQIPRRMPENLPDYSLNGHTLLLVEDMDSNMGYLKTLLRHTDATLLSASNGLEAVEMVRVHPEIDMVLMDVRMPGMNGIEATVHIKDIRPDLPVIGQTAFVSQEDKEAMTTAGFDDFIAKPVKGMLLHEKINWYLK